MCTNQKVSRRDVDCTAHCACRHLWPDGLGVLWPGGLGVLWPDGLHVLWPDGLGVLILRAIM